MKLKIRKANCVTEKLWYKQNTTILQFNNQFRLNLNRIVILYIRCIESSKYYVWKKFDKTCKFKIIYLLLQPLTRKARAFSSVGLEHLPYKQRVGGSNPSTPTLKGSFQSGQMGQTVNLLLLASVVRIHHYPQQKKKASPHRRCFFYAN